MEKNSTALLVVVMHDVQFLSAVSYRKLQHAIIANNFYDLAPEIYLIGIYLEIQSVFYLVGRSFG